MKDLKNKKAKVARALVVSGGGSKGAFAAGVATYLIEEKEISYDLFVGTSTGSLLAPLLASNQLAKAKEVFTNITERDIFSQCPFKIVKVNGLTKTKFNHWVIIKMFLRGENTLGESKNLRKLISSTFTKDDFFKVRSNKKEVIVTVSNLTKQCIEYKSSNDYDYESFCDWIWASANLLPFMSLVTINGCQYGDGGFGDLIPIQVAIDNGVEKVDVIVLRQENKEVDLPLVTNPFQTMNRTYDFMFQQLAKDDVIIGKLAASNKNVDIRFYYTQRLLTENSFIFDPIEMRNWWNEGRSTFQERKPHKVSL